MNKSVLCIAFLLATSVSSARPVLIRYQENTLPLSLMSPTQTVAALKSRNLRNTSAVFGRRALKSGVLDLWLIQSSWADLSTEQIELIRKNPLVVSVEDSTRRVHLVTTSTGAGNKDESQYTYGLQKIGIPQVRERFPNRDGRGVRVGILDTGIDATHSALTGRLATFKDFISGEQKPAYDDHGHGTHVAGTIAGTKVGDLNIGIAPAVQLVVAKVFNSTGSSATETLLAGMQWVADPSGNSSLEDAPMLVSNSWSADPINMKNTDPVNDPFCRAVSMWKNLGIIPVFAAGNDGPSPETVSIPAACPDAIAVGATDSNDQLVDFSSKGPANWLMFSLNKPDLSAPGLDIESAQAGGGIAVKSGTSMATPHVAGVLALLLQGHKRSDDAQAIDALIKSANNLGNTAQPNEIGAGRLDALAALKIFP